MHERRDWDLLRAFVDTNSQAAFAELTKRYLRLVYATCLREVGDRTLAEDVTQAVFLLLARKASTFRSNIVLTSWLFDACKYASRNALRGERRRHMREQKMAMEVRSTVSGRSSEAVGDSDSHIGEALDSLAPMDRNAVLLRFVCDYTLAETGAAVGISEEAARKRVNRALAKLRTALTRGGAPLTIAAAAELVQAHHAHAMPANLEAKIAQIVQAHVAAPLAGAPIPQIAQGAQTAMTLAKIQSIAAIAGGLILAGGGVYLAGAKSLHAPRHAKIATQRVLPPDTHAAAFALYVKMNEAYAAMKSCSFTETASGSGAMGMPYQMQYTFQKPDQFNIVITRHGAAKRVLYHSGKIWTIPRDGSTPAASRPVLHSYTPLMDGLIGAADVKTPLPEIMLVGTQMETQTTLSQNTKIKNGIVLGEPSTVDGVPVDTIIFPYNPNDKDTFDSATFYIGRADHLIRRVVSQDESGSHPELNLTITYSDLKVNPRIPASTFEYTPEAP